MTISSNSPDAAYRGRIASLTSDEQALSRKDLWLSHIRVAAFLLAVVLFVVGWWAGLGRLWWLPGAAALFGFVALVTWHESLRRRLVRAGILRDINQQGLARRKRNWKGLREEPIEVPPQHLAVSTDLDLFGHASLYQLMNCCGTPIGRITLRNWLLEGADPAEIKVRQTAVAELAERRELREELTLEGRLLAGASSEQFVDWAGGDRWLARRPWLKWLARATPVVALSSVLLAVARVVSPDVALITILAVIALNTLVAVAWGSSTHDIFKAVGARQGEAAGFLRMFELMYAMPASTGKLATLHRETTELGGGVLPRMRELRWVIQAANISHSALLFFLVYLPLQALALYDFHVLDVLEVWQRKHGPHVRRWFEALGQFEALVSLATLAHDHPTWTFPLVDTAADRLTARELGHPLLSDDARVTNDVSVGPAGTFLLVTGSNMSGKSTLLRSIGLNAALAQTGAPVCAAEFHMPPVALATSIRVRDSLEDGVSFYMAELMRLKSIVDQAVAFDSRSDRQLLYLLDEILQGTNSKERHIAVMRVVSHLLAHRAIGAISTHDLELASSEPLAAHCHAVHFRETLHDRNAERPMTFDYRLRPGVATTTNALKLLEIVGLSD